MEESVWISFGILAVLVTLGILITIFTAYRADSSADNFFLAVEQLGQQAELVCKSPLDTMLSIAVTIPAGALLAAEGDRLCGSYEGSQRCVRTTCALQEGTILNLTAPELQGLFSTRQYTCSVLNANSLAISCQG